MLKVLQAFNKYFLVLILMMIVGCSSNPELSSLNTDGIKFIGIVPLLPRDTLEVYYNKTIDENIYTEYSPSEEEEKVIQNNIVYYYANDPQKIEYIIDDLKNGLPSFLSVFGASYGVPTLMVEIHWQDRKQNIGIIPTDGIENAFYRNRDKLNYVLLGKYLLSRKEKGLSLVEDLNSNRVKWYIKNYNIRNYENKRLFSYSLLINFSSIVSYSETEKQIQLFLKDISSSISKLEYETSQQYSNVGFPISVHLFLSSQDEVTLVNGRAKEIGHKTFYESEAIEIYIEERQSIPFKNIIEEYNLLKVKN